MKEEKITIELPKVIIDFLNKSARVFGKDAKWAIEEFTFRAIKNLSEVK